MKISRTGIAVLLMASVWALSSAAAAQAIIQVQRGISGIRLKMPTDQVKASLGAPAHVQHGSNPFGTFTEYRYKGGITVTFQGNKNVTAVAITGHSDQTASGVGVGSTEAQVRQGVPGVRCDAGNHPGGVTSCHVGSFKPGGRVTDFLLRRGRVSRVTVGFVLD